jgi:prepilin-type N-terminal cleavage/methylation domain-containing protein
MKKNGFNLMTPRFARSLRGIQKGFTLIELLLVIAIVLVLGGLTTPFYARFLNQNSIANALDQLAGQFRKAQIYSMEGKANTSWGVKIGANKIILFATGNPAFDETFDYSSALSISGFASVTFAKITGLPDTTPTIILSATGNSKTLTINSQGVINR